MGLALFLVALLQTGAAAACFGSWLGDPPLDARLKRRLLGEP